MGDLGGMSEEVSGEIRVPLDDTELEDEGSTLDEPVMTTLVSPLGVHVHGGVQWYMYGLFLVLLARTAVSGGGAGSRGNSFVVMFDQGV